MDTKHTKGPWQIIPYPDGHSFIREGVAPERFVANVSTSNDEGKANARLIAAAPDMLEALTKARAFIEAELDARGPDVAGVALASLNAVDAAIAKATGEIV
jgi:hypothetical protein